MMSKPTLKNLLRRNTMMYFFFLVANLALIKTGIAQSPPVLACPVDELTVECGQEDVNAWIATATATDPDGPEPVNITFQIVNSVNNCGNTWVDTYEFTATDVDGMTATCIASYGIEDTQAPVIDMMAMDLTVECDGDGNNAELNSWLDNIANAGATDNCSSELIWSWNLISNENSCGITSVQTFEFTVVDQCGNSSSTLGTFTIQDTESPVISGGEDYAGACDDSGANNDDEFISWLLSNAGATANDVCGNLVWTNDYDVANWEYFCGDSKTITVNFTATDECGNSATISHSFSLGDVEVPVFVNCPRPPVVVEVSEGNCAAYVNFSAPQATDNCGAVTITQIDGSGLGSGDLFPIGTTVLTYEAEDACGNIETCSFLVIVNDNNSPVIECPGDQSVMNDPFECGAIVDNIAPVMIDDNCSVDLAVLFEVKDAGGEVIYCGINDASGLSFPVGNSSVEYHVVDQSVFMITEIVQSGADAIELTNFGPSSLNISNLVIERQGAGAESFMVPNVTILNVGQTYTYNFANNTAESDATGYRVSMAGVVLDEVAVNGYGLGGNWSGSISGGDVWRNRICDHDDSSDWSVATLCDDNTIGGLNPGLSVYADNGTTKGLQSNLPNVVSCSFNVNVEDAEYPSCAEYSETVYFGSSALINGPSCVSSTLFVGANNTVGQIDVRNLNIAFSDMGALEAYLTSPNGTKIELFSGLCNGTSNTNISLSDTAAQSVAIAPCSPLGNGGTYQPSTPLHSFTGENSFGNWTLTLSVADDANGVLNGWSLYINSFSPYSQENVTIVNLPDECGADYEWTHPVFQDNCVNGIMTVEYLSDNAAYVPNGGFIDSGSPASEYFGVGTTTVLYTLTDDSGLSSICSFEVTVEDNQAPEIVQCLSNQVISLDAGECCMVLNFQTPWAADNCGISNIEFYPPSGSEFCIGLHNIEVTVSDASGNTATCNFTVEVIEYEVELPFNFACNDLVYVSLGADCEATIEADMILEGSNYGCYDNYCITITDLDGNVIPGNTLDQSHVGQYFNVSVGDCFTGGSSCWGQIYLENKTTPEIECPSDITLACNDPYDANSTGLVILLSCEADAEATYTDQITDYGVCAEPRAHITRTWLVTDDSGNTASCIQNITIIPFDLDDVSFPNDLTGDDALSCSDVNNDPSLLHPDITGEPNIDGISLFGDHFCDVNIGYWDETLIDANCGGAYEILRHWVVRDECQPLVEGINPIKHIQAIKVEDYEGPNLQTFYDITISTDTWGCGATYVLPTPYIEDNCTPTDDIQLSYSVIGGVIQNGVLYMQDPANGKTALVTVWAQDACGNTSNKSFTVHAIDNLAPNLVADAHTVVSVNANGEAYSDAINFDDGSTDGCGPLGYFVRRMNTSCQGYENEDNPNTWHPAVHFCCADIKFDNDGEPIPVMVQFRVCDDGNADGIIGNLGDNCSTAMIEVVVQDKIAPQLECPDDITIECKDFAILGDLSKYTNDELDQLFGAAYATSSCGNTYKQTITPKTLCGTGTISRIISVTTAGGSAACIQKIHVVADLEHKFSCDKMYFENYPESSYKWCLSASNGGPVQDFGAIQINSADCGEFTPQPLTIDYEDLCANPYVNMTIDTFEFAGGGCFKYLVHWEVIDECVFDENFVDPATGETNPYHTDNGYFHIYVEYDVFDKVGPVLDCVSEYIIPCDEGGLDQITLDGHDACTPDNFLSWNYTVDIGNNFTIDGQGTGNTATGPFPIGTHRIIWVVSDGCGNTTTENCVFSVVYDDQKAPTPVCHDGLSTTVMQQPACNIQVWASDFDASSYDDCDDELYFTMIPEIDASNSSDPYADATPSWTFDCSYITNGVFEEIPLRIYATDNTGKYDWCTTTLRIDDHFDCCEDGEGMNLIIAGKVLTEEGEGVEEVTIQTIADSPEYPIYDITGPDGGYAFIFNPYFYDYTLSSDKSFAYMNGVTTLDLVMIQKHILNIDPLESPYKKIAADINSDCNITALDLLQLRKLILGIYPDDILPDNSSWRFVDQTYEFSDPNIFCGFEELLNIDLLEKDEYNMNFVGVKIGDVNASAQANLNSSAETRNNESTKFIIDAATLEAGNAQWIDFYASDFNEVSGFQFTLNINSAKAEFVNIRAGLLSVSEQNFGLTRAEEGLITVSWNNATSVSATDQEALFSILLKAKEEADIQELIQINDRRINAEIYKGKTLEIERIGLEIREGDLVYENLNFELYQNEPNPFDKNTVIGFQLPEANNVELQLFDATGKLIKRFSGEFAKGYHEIQIHKAELSATGLIYYKLSAGAETATRKMIILN